MKFARNVNDGLSAYRKANETSSMKFTRHDILCAPQDQNDEPSAERKALYDDMLIDLVHEDIRQKDSVIRIKLIWGVLIFYALIIAYGKFHHLLPWHVT